jgi:gluconate 2-dehydrogenase gamma chain
MSDISRRQALNQLAAAFVAAGVVDRVAARDLHAAVQEAAAAGLRTGNALSSQQFRTLDRLTDLILPADQGSAGAVQAGVAQWIDSLIDVNADLESRYVKGLTWLDTTMNAQHGTDFVSATPAQQATLLDSIAYKKNQTADNRAAVEFFALVRRMTVDGFYTSNVGIHDLIPQGRPPHLTYVVPKEDVDYVLSRSPFGK